MSSREKVIAVVDDHPLIAKALGELLAIRGYKTRDFLQFTAFREWLEKQEPVDLCIVDYNLPDIAGNDIVPSIKECRDVPVAIWSGRDDEGLSQAVLEQGAIGFISKGVSITALPPAIDLMLAGEIFVSSCRKSSVYADGKAQLRKPLPPVQKVMGKPSLTPREQEVMELLLQGLSNKEIATRLSLNPVTIKLHNRSIFRKLKVRNRTEATVRYLELTGGLTLSRAC